MKPYYEEMDSIYHRLGGDILSTLEVIGNRYIGENPPIPFAFKCFNKAGILQTEEGRYDIDLSIKLPGTEQYHYGYAFGMIWSDGRRFIEAAVSCYGPVKIYQNKKLVFESGVVEEVNCNHRKAIPISLEPGWNTFFISMRKVPSGFGCIFGSNRSSLNLMDFMAPFAERKGQGGWIYSEAMEQDVFGEGNIPDFSEREDQQPLLWYPNNQWEMEQIDLSSCRRIFGMETGKHCYAWSCISVLEKGIQKGILRGNTTGPLTLWVDGQKVYQAETEQMFEVSLDFPYGVHSILVNAKAGMEDWGFSLEVWIEDRVWELQPPCPIQGIKDPWLYLGPFEEEQEYCPEEVQSLYRLFGSGDAKIYWKVDHPNTWIRPYIDNKLFARWSYPLGVTLYGLLKTGRLLKKQDMITYVGRHLAECCGMHQYAIWDQEQYGYPSINQKLVELKMLDDCGSMGATMLEAYGEVYKLHQQGQIKQEPDFDYVGEMIADYILNQQERKEDGVLYRSSKGYFMENTMWADDLYMSTPFLIRSYQKTGEKKYLDEAVKQFFLFQKYLFMPDVKLMSHVYDFKYNTPNYIPWGRGNGWPLFSLSELLEVVPEEYPKRIDLIDFFNEFCEGVQKLQGDNGLWHQVLNDEDAYEETSCTAMFIYAFCRGIRFGWLKERAPYLKAVQQAWLGLTKKSIDRYGNIYGVCGGSRYSYKPEYYKEQLLPVINDTHGIGIVLLAGIEKIRLDSFLAEEERM